MPHTNTIEALTLELDRVNEQKRVMLEKLKDVLADYQCAYDMQAVQSVMGDTIDIRNTSAARCDNFLMPRISAIREAIQKAESR